MIATASCFMPWPIRTRATAPTYRWPVSPLILFRRPLIQRTSDFTRIPGFDVFGLTRAVIQAARDQEAVAGTSTITQQLVRATLLDEDERTERSYRRKVREIILAAEISRTYSKEEILELYLNEIYYGNLAYGIEAASNTYSAISSRLLFEGGSLTVLKRR